MDDADRRLLATFGEFMELALNERHDHVDDSRDRLRDVLSAHLGRTVTEVPVARLDVPATEFVNLDVAVAALIEDCGGGEITGVGGGDQRHHSTFADLVQRGYHAPVAPVDRTRVETGPDTARDAVSFGVHLFTYSGEPVAIMQRRSDPRFGMQAGLEVMASRETADQILADIQRLMIERNVFRGQVLSFASMGGEYERQAGGVRFHARPDIEARDVILPEGSLSRIERHIVGTAAHRDTLLAAGQHLKRGLLLYGPPGTGKTHTVRYLLGRLDGVTCFLLSGNSLDLIGQTATLAQALAPSLVVLEDVDLIAEERGHFGPQPFLFTLLDAMDGLAGESDVAFVLTTNRADLLERALSQRPGRIDLAIEVPLPDEAARRQLLTLYARSLPVSDTALNAVAARTEGVTASFFKELTRRTVLVAADQGQAVDDALIAAVLDEMLDDAESLTRSLLGAGTGDASRDAADHDEGGFGYVDSRPSVYPG